MAIKIFVDTASATEARDLITAGLAVGVTSNPTLMRSSGVTGYESACRSLIEASYPRPCSVEVIADSSSEIVDQARTIARWGSNVFVKVPGFTTVGSVNSDVVRTLAAEGVHLNVTALMTKEHIESFVESLEAGPESILSIFAGRIADTGRDPIPIVRECARAVAGFDISLLWASSREILNVVHAADAGADIITLTPNLIQKMGTFGKDLDRFAIETAAMFFEDAMASGFTVAG